MGSRADRYPGAALLVLLLAVSVAGFAVPVAADEGLETLWATIGSIERQMMELNAQTARYSAQLDDLSRRIVALKDGGINFIEEIQLNSYLRDSQNLALKLRANDSKVKLLQDTRATLVDRAIRAVSVELATRTARLRTLQEQGNGAEFSRVLVEVVGYDNLKRDLEARRALPLASVRPVPLQITDWNSPRELREKAAILRDEEANLTRELALTGDRIQGTVGEIRQKEELIRFIRDLQSSRSERVSVVDPGSIPHLQGQLEHLRSELVQLRSYSGTLQVEMAKVREQTGKLDTYAAQLERELLR